MDIHKNSMSLFNIPNNEEGLLFKKLIRKYKNKKMWVNYRSRERKRIVNMDREYTGWWGTYMYLKKPHREKDQPWRVVNQNTNEQFWVRASDNGRANWVALQYLGWHTVHPRNENNKIMDSMGKWVDYNRYDEMGLKTILRTKEQVEKSLIIYP